MMPRCQQFFFFFFCAASSGSVGLECALCRPPSSSSRASKAASSSPPPALARSSMAYVPYRVFCGGGGRSGRATSLINNRSMTTVLTSNSRYSRRCFCSSSSRPLTFLSGAALSSASSALTALKRLSWDCSCSSCAHDQYDQYPSVHQQINSEQINNPPASAWCWTPAAAAG